MRWSPTARKYKIEYNILSRREHQLRRDFGTVAGCRQTDREREREGEKEKIETDRQREREKRKERKDKEKQMFRGTYRKNKRETKK